MVNCSYWPIRCSMSFDARQEPALPAESGHKTNCRSDRSGAAEPDSGPPSDRSRVPRSARDYRASAGCPRWFIAVALADASVDSN